MASRITTPSGNPGNRSKQQATSQASLLKFRRKASAMATSSEEAIEPGYLTTDTSFSHVVTMIVLRICRKYVLDPSMFKRLLCYFVLIVFGGIVADFAPILVRAFMPVRTAKDGILNQYFVKLGWAWTLALVVPFVTMTSQVMSTFVSKDEADALKESQVLVSAGPSGSPRYNTRSTSRLSSSNVTTVDGDVQVNASGDSEEPSKMSKAITLFFKVASFALNKDVMRIVVNTVIWYISVNSMVSIERNYGSCSTSPLATGTGAKSAGGLFIASNSKRDCTSKGGIWTGWDISGHTFLLMFSVLLLIEETSIMDGWEPFGHHLNAENQRFTKELKIGSHRQFNSFNYYCAFIRVNFILITLLIILWEFMLMQTALFYHTMVQKAIAAVWATISWFVLYRIVYPSRYVQPFIRSPNKPAIEV